MAGSTTHEPDGTCRSCPVCLLISTVSELQPEAAVHLAAAGRELVLALRAVLAAEPPSGGDVYGRHRRGTSPATASDRADDADARCPADTLRRIVVD
jgi:hypothetical protein